MSRSLRALLISSNRIVSEDYYGAVAGCGLEVSLAQSLREATRTLLTEPVDVIVCDDNALDISFTAIVEAARCLRGNIPIIIWSSDMDQRDPCWPEAGHAERFPVSATRSGENEFERETNRIASLEKVC